MSEYLSNLSNTYASELLSQANYTPSSSKANMILTDKQTQELSSQDFLNLMMEQLKNQDFMNPMSDTEFLSQLAQFSSMQYMQELAGYSKQNLVASLVGQTVTASKYTASGELDTTTGLVTRIVLDDDYTVYIGDKSYTLDQVKEIGSMASASQAPVTGTDEDDGEDYLYQTSFYLALLGSLVTVKDASGNETTGFVDRVSMNDGIKLMVNGVWYGAADLVSVDAGEEGSAESAGSIESAENIGSSPAEDEESWASEGMGLLDRYYAMGGSYRGTGDTAADREGIETGAVSADMA